MPHDVPLIATTAIGFVLAFAMGFLADRVRLPPLVGYLLAGVIVGPFTPGFVADGDLAGQLSEMGVILLMFGVGLHFSIGDLMAVRWIALPGAAGQITLATLMGVGLTSLWGWSLGAGLVLGLSLSVASTVVLLRALEERNALGTPNGRVAVGWLIVEDLAMVLALVLLPAFAETLGGHAPAGGGHGAPTGETSLALMLAITLGKVAAFAALALLLGPKVVPWLLGQVARTGSRELFTLSVLALALGIAYGAATIFGVSFALGAFFAGMVLSESHFGHRAAAESLPLQDAFSVLFFVSVGMLFDPSILMREPIAVLAVLSLILVGKSLIAFGVVLLLRYPVGTALTVSASLAQIGEFSFILAGLGMTYGLLPQEGRDLILAGALLSITLNPFVFGAAKLLEKRLHRWDAVGQNRYRALEQELEQARRRSEEREEARSIKVRELIERFPMFAALDRRQHEELLLLFRPASASPGDRVVRQGDRGDGIYFIVSGGVEVWTGERKIPLAAGDFFGEMALLDGGRRNADVVAVDFCQFLTLSRRDFRMFTARHPNLLAMFSRMADERREVNRQQAAPTADPAPG